MPFRSRRLAVWGLVLGALALGAVCARPIAYLAWVAAGDTGVEPLLAPGTRDDASHLETAAVSEVVEVPADDEAALAAIRGALERARATGAEISIAGARHSMGGHTIAAQGIVLDMLARKRVELAAGARVARAQAGATWHDVLRAIDPAGLSVAVMQSNNVFTVGGSVSVNCHGWQPDHAPIAATVRALRLVTAGGELLCCSRSENAELFALVLGGYGLFGVILDVELELVANETYVAERFLVPVSGYTELFEREVLARTADTGLAFGRLDVSPDAFLEEAVLTVFRRDAVARSGTAHRARLEGAEAPRLPWLGGQRLRQGPALVGGVRPRRSPVLRARHAQPAPGRRPLGAREPRSRGDRDPAGVLRAAGRPDGVRRAAARCRARARRRSLERDAARRERRRRHVPALRRRPHGRAGPAPAPGAQCRSGCARRALHAHARRRCPRAGRPSLPPVSLARDARAARGRLSDGARFFEKKRAYDPLELFQSRFYRTYAF